jgi:hypothetical protein
VFVVSFVLEQALKSSRFFRLRGHIPSIDKSGKCLTTNWSCFSLLKLIQKLLSFAEKLEKTWIKLKISIKLSRLSSSSLRRILRFHQETLQLSHKLSLITRFCREKVMSSVREHLRMHDILIIFLFWVLPNETILAEFKEKLHSNSKAIFFSFRKLFPANETSTWQFKSNSKLTVKLERYNGSHSNVAEESSLRVFGEENWCEISSVAPTVSANLRRIDYFQTISNVSKKNKRWISATKRTIALTDYLR